MTFAGASTLMQGMELETARVPLHKVILNCDIVSGLVMVGVRHLLPIKGIDLILGNDLAGEKVTAIPYMLNSQGEVQNCTDEVVVYPACAVTRTMTKRTQGESQPVEKVSTTNRDEEEQLELADTFIAHDKELASE